MRGRIFSFDVDAAGPIVPTEHTPTLLPTGFPSFAGGLVSFGEDAAGELYLVDIRGAVYQIVPEPAALPLLACPIIFLIAWQRRRKSTRFAADSPSGGILSRLV